MTKRRWLGVAGAVAFLLLAGRLVAGIYVDYRWYASLGAGPLAVWRTRVTDLAAIRVVLTLAASAFLFANLYGVSSSVESLVLPRRLGDLEIGERVPGRRLLWAAAAVAVLAGIALSLVVDDWMSFDLVQFARPFGVTDPYTDSDLGFFVYWLPFENALYFWAISLLLASAGLAMLLYVLTAGLRWERGRLHATRHVRRHLTVLAAGLLLVLAWGHRLDAYALVGLGTGSDGAFTFLDDQIALRARFALAAVTGVASLVVLNAGWQGQPRLTFWVIASVLALTLVLRVVLPAIGGRVVGPEEFARRNVPYLRNRAAVTQTAYGVNVVRAAPPGYGLPDVGATDGAVPLWDPTALSRAVERQRRGEIVPDELGWQSIGGRLGAVAVLRSAPPPDAEPPAWNVVTVAASVADAAGEPVPVDSAGLPSATSQVRERRLLAFPQANGYAVVSDTTGRLTGDHIGSFWARLAHAWDQRDLRLVLDQSVDRIESPVIVLHRGVGERIDAVTPFFVRGRSVAPVLARDTLYWVSHLYAASATFPLSQRYTVGSETWGYFRHAAIAIVNAESGAVTIVADAAPDHVAEAWMRRFPALFTPASTLPPSLAAALPPATDGVLLQAWALSQYGSRADFTAGPVHFPGGDSGDSTVGVGARSLALLPAPNPPGDRTPAWTLPLLDASDRVAGVLVALGGARPATVWVPSSRVSVRWSDATERLRATASAPPIGKGREIARGRVMAVPVDGGLAYVQGLYAVREDGRSIVAGMAGLFADTARVGRSPREALGGGYAPSTGEPRASSAPGPSSSERLGTLYDAMRAALRRGDWAAFGAAFDSLGAAIARTPR